MDMISKIELEDALKSRIKLDERILEVALIVATAKEYLHPKMREGKPYSVNNWRLRRWHISKAPKYSADQGDRIVVMIEISWFDAPETQKYGAPEEVSDISEEDYFCKSTEYLIRYVEFPESYVTTNNWEADLEKKIAFNKINKADINVRSTTSHLAHLKQEVKKAEADLAEAEGSLIHLKEEYRIKYGERIL